MEFDSQFISTIGSFPHPASFKEADTGKYIAVSQTAAHQMFGVTDPADLIGQKMEKMTAFLDPKFAAVYRDIATQHDFLVREKKEAVVKEYAFLAASGDVSYRRVTKHPSLGSQRNLLAIFTQSYDLKSSFLFPDLYQLYRNFYNTQEAIKRTLSYLEIESSFITLPSEAQLRVFLEKAHRHPHKQIARNLKLSPRTVDCHLDVLRSKVVDGDLPRVLALLERRKAESTDNLELS
jgi:hypothetical protein